MPASRSPLPLHLRFGTLAGAFLGTLQSYCMQFLGAHGILLGT